MSFEIIHPCAHSSPLILRCQNAWHAIEWHNSGSFVLIYHPHHRSELVLHALAPDYQLPPCVSWLATWRRIFRRGLFEMTDRHVGYTISYLRHAARYELILPASWEHRFVQAWYRRLDRLRGRKPIDRSKNAFFL